MGATGFKRFHAMDGMRGLAALLVVVYHVGQNTSDGASLGASGYLAVDFFFLLSGFVIAHAYQDRLKQGMGLARFAQVRLVRLYPMFLLGLAIACIKPLAQIATGDDMAPAIGSLAVWSGMNAVMLPAALSESLFPLNPPAWSLFLEVVVNILFAVAMVHAPVWALAVVAAIAAACVLASGLAHHTLDIGWSWSGLPGGVARVMYSFTVGVLMFRLGMGATRRESWFVLIPMGLLLAVLWPEQDEAVRGLLNAATVILVFPALLMMAARWEAPAAIRPACNLSGDVSYPLYIIHYPLLFLYLLVAQRIAGFGILAALPYVPLALGASWLALRFFDVPVRAWLGTRLRPASGKVVAAG